MKKIEDLDLYRDDPSNPKRGTVGWRDNIRKGLKESSKKGGSSEQAILARKLIAQVKRQKLINYEALKAVLLEHYPGLDKLSEEEIKVLLEHYLNLGIEFESK